jgi:hypothetical protein
VADDEVGPDAEASRRLSDEEETMLLRRALTGDAARRSGADGGGQCVVEVYGVDGRLMSIVTVPPGGASIGRGPDQDIRLPDRTVSRRHARLEFAGGRWWLDDAGSLNDTLLDGEPVKGRAPLSDGARLTVGLHELLISIR